MPANNRYEQQFLDALKDVFVGAEVEGDSGYINLMKIKSRYYTESVFPQLMKDIDAACKPFELSFREELFDKLYDFFKRYFSESGSIYFRHTPLYSNVYEKVYTDDRDVMLFWKTHMLYYVKTDRLFNSMEVNVDGTVFSFDASELEHKRSNEKRELTYTFQGYKKGKVSLSVAYSEKGRKTKPEDILGALEGKGIDLEEETLERAFRIFEKQSEVDYFINKNAKAFLKEQFDLWLYQYVFACESVWSETRLRQLQALKEIACHIVDFVAQFEDELVRVWNKPKFVLNSHYIITLDRITDPSLLGKILGHKGMRAQVEEWKDLGLVEKTFKLGKLDEKNLFQEPAHAKYQFLPLDTRYFPDLELDVLAQFDDLDSELDGWLIHSENYQALNTLLPKFKEKVQAIYADPPYNTDAGPIDYANDYRSSSWLSLIENRMEISRQLLSESGIICVTIDDYQVHELGELLDGIFGRANQLGTVVIRNNPSGRSTVKGISICHEYAFFYQKTDAARLARLPRSERQLERFTVEEGERVSWQNFRKGGGALTYRAERPKQFYPIYVDPKARTLRIPALSWNSKKREWDVLENPGRGERTVLPVDEKGNERVWSLNHESAMRNIKALEVRVAKDGTVQIYRRHKPSEGVLPRSWWDKNTYAAREYGSATLKDLFGESYTFSFAKSPFAVQDCIWIAGLDEGSDNQVVDFFAGSGTTAHAVINLNRADEDGGRRKYILVEMGEHFDTVILPRIKKVVFSDKWKDGKAQDGKGISHFCKYFQLEQYEDTLRRARYDTRGGLFAATDAYNSYVFLRDLKMLDAVSLDRPKNKVDVHVEKLYDGIDLAETLSCVTGKGIRRITEDEVIFQDGTSASLASPDWGLVKPLVWW